MGAAANRPPGVVEPLPELWRAWTRIIGLFAKRGRSSLRPSPGEYESLHRALLALCEDHATTSEYYRQLGEMVRPWITLHVLQVTDHGLLSELYKRCRRIDQDLHGGDESRDERARWLTPTIVAWVLVPCVLGVCAFSGLYGWVSDKLNTWSFVVHLWWVRRTTAEVILLAGVVIGVAACFVVSRTHRS